MFCLYPHSSDQTQSKVPPGMFSTSRGPFYDCKIQDTWFPQRPVVCWKLRYRLEHGWSQNNGHTDRILNLQDCIQQFSAKKVIMQ